MLSLYEISVERDALVRKKEGHIERKIVEITDKELIDRFNKEEYFNPMTNLLTEMLRVSDAAGVS